jgi:hypothetical protein
MPKAIKANKLDIRKCDQLNHYHYDARFGCPKCPNDYEQLEHWAKQCLKDCKLYKGLQEAIDQLERKRKVI